MGWGAERSTRRWNTYPGLQDRSEVRFHCSANILTVLLLIPFRPRLLPRYLDTRCRAAGHQCAVARMASPDAMRRQWDGTRLSKLITWYEWPYVRRRHVCARLISHVGNFKRA